LPIIKAGYFLENFAKALVFQSLLLLGIKKFIKSGLEPKNRRVEDMI